MSNIKQKITDVLEQRFDYDLRNAYMRDLLASEITSKVDESYQMPKQTHDAEEKRKLESKSEQGLFEKYLEDPSSVDEIPQEATEAMVNQRQSEYKKNTVNRKKAPVTAPNIKKKPEKPQMSDFFDKPEKVTPKKVAPKKVAPKKVVPKKNRRGLKNLGKN